jgi:bla regulator protein blaR1
MRTDSRELLAVGIFGRARLASRIEMLLKRGREFSPRVSRVRIAVSLAILLTLATAGAVAPRWIAFAQQPVATQPPKYEVSSIKPNAGGDFPYTFHTEPNGSFTATAVTLKRLMMTGYQHQGYRIVGGPAWVNSQRWDVQAKYSVSRPVSDNEFPQMLRTLLAVRFQIHTHSETRSLPIYELVVDRKGSKLRRVDGGKTKLEIQTGNGLIRFTKATARTFASQLGYALGRPVIDKTGLSGEFSFALDWTPALREDGGPTTSGLPPETPEQPPSITDGPSIFTAITKQLGLRLESGRGPVEVLVIDHAEKPDAN